MILFALSLFFTEPAPIDMPRAEAYLVRENGMSFLEDRYLRIDLWGSQAMLGRWIDADGRVFGLAQFGVSPPMAGFCESVTRVKFEEEKRPMPRVRANRDFPREFRSALNWQSGLIGTVEKPRAPRQLPRGYRYVYYWQHPTNYSDIVCTFLPERTNVWYWAHWSLVPGDDYPTQMAAFEDQFLRKEFGEFIKDRDTYPPSEASCEAGAMRGETQRDKAGQTRCLCDSVSKSTERNLLRRDAHHSIAAYANWHFTGAEEFAVLDDLPSRSFVETLTNDFPVMRAKYAAALPTPLNGSNVLCVARIYATRDEYLDALETDGITNMTWSAAYWSPQRRELVAYLPPDGGQELLRTIRHEAFHQYLSYATSMISASPWLNEGYAQYFEDDGNAEWGEGVELTDENLDRMAAAIPPLLLMDYAQFYDGNDFARRFKYRLAWSIVRFLEKGADEVRLKPFAGLKQRYVEALLETRDMRRATSAAFKDEDLLKKFIAEWKKFWKNQ